MRKIRTICSISPCPSYDGVVATVESGKLVKIEGDKDHPWSQGHTCPKGRHEWEVLYHPQRFTQPLLKTPSGMQEISWDEAIEVAAERLGEMRARYGPLSICSTLPSPPVVLFTGSLWTNVNAVMSYDPPYDPEIGINRVQGVVCQVRKF